MKRVYYLKHLILIELCCSGYSKYYYYNLGQNKSNIWTTSPPPPPPPFQRCQNGRFILCASSSLLWGRGGGGGGWGLIVPFYSVQDCRSKCQSQSLKKVLSRTTRNTLIWTTTLHDRRTPGRVQTIYCINILQCRVVQSTIKLIQD